MVFYILVFVLSFVVIARSGAMLVGSLTRLAKFLGISEYIIAFVLMSIVTSVPELFVGVSSVFQGVPALSFGNIIGANLINLTLVIGVVAVLSNGIKIESKISRENFLLIFFIAFLPILLVSDGVISRGDGFVLLFSFLIYIWKLLGEKEYFTKVISDWNFTSENTLKTMRSLWRFALGISLLLLGAFFLVWSAKALAIGSGIGLVVFGIIFIALGTALPELAFGIRASLMKHTSMTLGNSLGSIAFNATFILGVMALIKPIYLAPNFNLMAAIVFLFIAFVMFNIFAYSRSSISRNEGVVLILLYIVFLAVQYFI